MPGEDPILRQYRSVRHFRYMRALSGSDEGPELVPASRWEVFRALVRRSVNKTSQKVVRNEVAQAIAIGVIASVIAGGIVYLLGWN